MPTLVSMNVGTPRPIMYRGKTVMTSIFKQPVSGRVQIARVNVAGDRQADPRVHGGHFKAVYAYATEDYATQPRGSDQGSFPSVRTQGDVRPFRLGQDLSAQPIGNSRRHGSNLSERGRPGRPFEERATFESVFRL